MNTDEDLKNTVKNAYGKIAREAKSQNVSSSCCDSGCGCSAEAGMAERYTHLPGYVPEADLGLGCGIPTEGAGIRPGHVVLDLGSGAGNDVFVARRLVGEKGTVLGVDFTETMIQRANANKQKLGYENVEFRLGDIEHLPVDSGSVDVVISNCVLNLVPDKSLAFAEIFRVLKSGGHFSISDIVLEKPLPEALLLIAGLYVECVSGAKLRKEYLDIIQKTGFRNVRILKEKKVILARELLETSTGGTVQTDLPMNDPEITSITVVGEKP